MFMPPGLVVAHIATLMDLAILPSFMDLITRITAAQFMSVLGLGTRFRAIAPSTDNPPLQRAVRDFFERTAHRTGRRLFCLTKLGNAGNEGRRHICLVNQQETPMRTSWSGSLKV
jgi:hypothetical protein